MSIDKLLSSAVKLWLKSQVSVAENLTVKIAGKNREILRGYIPEVFLYSSHSIYRGIHFSELTIKGTKIGFNLPQVLKRKPLQLLEPVVVDIKVLLLKSDLENSLSSSLLADGLTDLWSHFLLVNSLQSTSDRDLYRWHHLSLFTSGIHFWGNYNQEWENPIGIKTEVRLQDARNLLLSPQHIVTVPELPIADTKTLTFNLGEQVTITQLEITSESLTLQGTIVIFP